MSTPTTRSIEHLRAEGWIEVPVTRGLFTLIDAADAPMVLCRKWQAHKRRDGKGWYIQNSDGVPLHRVLLGAGDKQIVDHINGDGLDNRRSNLRIGTQSLNCVNRRTTPGATMRGTLRAGKRWRARIKISGKVVNLGRYDTEEEAHAAYVDRAKQEHGAWFPVA